VVRVTAVLLDTHVFLWLFSEPTRLGRRTLKMLEDPATTVLVSAVSAAEIAVKHGLGKLALAEAPASWVPRRISDGGLTPLALSIDHGLALARLPLHHRDPFDRLLVAQALVEDVPLVTGDGRLRAYPLTILDATDS
jgi:PIN domain nuclease of toxin-antitoxin system